MTVIYNTYTNAVLSAMDEATRKAGRIKGSCKESDFSFIHGSTICECGETAAVTACLIDDSGKIQESKAGYCDNCGKRY